MCVAYIDYQIETSLACLDLLVALDAPQQVSSILMQQLGREVENRLSRCMVKMAARQLAYVTSSP